jgi:hypothetical protein
MNKINPISIILVAGNNTSREIDIYQEIEGRRLFFISSGFTGTQAIPIETVKIQIKVSENTGWQYVANNSLDFTHFSITENIACGYIELPSICKIRLIATGIVGSNEIKIDLSY